MTSILIQRKRAARRRRPPTADHPANTIDKLTNAAAACGAADNCETIEIGPAGRSTPFADTKNDPAPSARIDHRLLTKALTIRRTEERLLDLFDQGKLFGTVHTCIGQEWVGVAVAETLKPGDMIFSNHRGHGHYLSWTNDVEGLLAEIMGKATGTSGGRGGSQHLCRDGFFSNGVQGGIMPIAAGLAMAKRLEGGSNIAVTFIGDGTLGQGVVYETLNIASKWSLPMLIVLEDNDVAQSTRQHETLAGTIKGRPYAFGIDVRCGDTWDPERLVTTAADAVRRVRQTRRPLVLHVKTYRLKAHSKGDDDRDSEEVARFARADTLNQVLATDSEHVDNIVAAINRRIDKAVEQADRAPFATPPEVDKELTTAAPINWKPVTFKAGRVVTAIRDALEEAMRRDERIILLGEDIRDPYGGAFKVTAGLSEKFGDRVRNTPISESAIVGIGNGLALAGWHPIVEIMFGDFLMLAADQFINHAAKFAGMYNDQVRVPVVIRTPMGGYRGYGPTHSQSLEKHLMGLPGTRLLAVHKRYCPGQLYQTLLAHNDRPTLVIENKLLYSQQTDPTPPAGCELAATDEAFPTVRIAPTGERQLTVVTYGGLVSAVETAIANLTDEDLACDLIIPMQLYPLNIEPVVESVAHTGRLLVVEEGQGFAGFGSELIAQLSADPRIASLKARRVHAASCPIPAARPAEHAVLPSSETITRAAIKLVTQ